MKTSSSNQNNNSKQPVQGQTLVPLFVVRSVSEKAIMNKSIHSLPIAASSWAKGQEALLEIIPVPIVQRQGSPWQWRAHHWATMWTQTGLEEPENPERTHREHMQSVHRWSQARRQTYNPRAERLQCKLAFSFPSRWLQLWYCECIALTQQFKS